MELHRLRLKNFRQYADAELRFDRGLTGIVGNNGCLIGETLVDMPRDLAKYPHGVPIRDLVGTQPLVYGYSEQERRFALARAARVWLTDADREVFRVKYTAGRGRLTDAHCELVGTYDHPVMLADGSYVPLGALRPGQRLMPLKRRIVDGVYAAVLRGKGEDLALEHRMVAEHVSGRTLRGTEHVHHLDQNPLNNTADNLRVMDARDHSALHGRLRPPQYTEHPRGMLGKHHSAAAVARIAEGARRTAAQTSVREARAQATRAWHAAQDRPWTNGERLREMYIGRGLSTVQIGGILGASSTTIGEWLRQHNIPLRSATEGSRLRQPNHTVLSVEPAGRAAVYDMEVPGLDNFVANGVVVHNSGKSTILEAIAFALYGVSATRGSKDSIKHRRAAPRASVAVECEFTVGTQRIRIERGLSNAAVFLGTLETPVATTLGGVTEWVERTLGMTRSEFFTTYFTGQKDLAVMGTLGPADRARFLSRVLGYDRLETAQTLVRDARRGIAAEITALRSTMPDPDALTQAHADAVARLTEAQQQAAQLAATEERTAAMEASLRPVWERAQATWSHQQTLVTTHGTLTQRAEALARDVLRLQQERDAIAEAVAALPAIEADLATLPALREEGVRLDREAAADTERQRLTGVRAHIEQQAAALPAPEVAAQAVTEWEHAVAQQTERVSEWLADVEKAERRFKAEDATWREQLAAARAELQQARAAVRPLIARREALVARGADAECSTCGVALGERFHTVLAALDAEIEAVTAQGKGLAESAAELEAEPDNVTEWREEFEGATRRLADERAVLDARKRELATAERVQGEAGRLRQQIEMIDAELAALPTTYDVARHQVVRTELARLAPLEAKRAVLADKAQQAARVAEALEQAETQARTIASERATIEQQLQASGLTAEQYEAMRREYTEAERAWRAAVDTARLARDAEARAVHYVEAAAQRIADTAAARQRLEGLTRDLVLHEELDRTMGDLRAELNHALRPELAELASGFLETLTDGRYTQAEFGEDYQLTVLEDGLPKPVISGGEEDLCNLVLRLAISQMIAERSGTPFSLLILDEVFAALDEQRRTNVLTLLRRLSDRFAQVIVITHNDHVRDALDHVIRVTLDVAAGESRVSYGEGPALPQADAVAVVDLAVAA